MGVTAAEVYQGADDPLDLTVTHDFATLAAARAFVASPELRDATLRDFVTKMRKSGQAFSVDG